MKKYFALFSKILASLFVLATISGHSQTLTILPDSVCVNSLEAYHVDSVEGFAYAWQVMAGTGVILSGQNTAHITIQWDGVAGVDTLKLLETNAHGCVSDPNYLTVVKIADPTINLNFADSTVCRGSEITFVSNHTGIPPFAFEWFKDDVLISGQSGDTLTIASADEFVDIGDYKVVISTPCSNDTSEVASLFVATPPEIYQQPNSLSVCMGDDAEFVVESTGGSLNYQWYKDGNQLPGETNNTLSIANMSMTHEGNYTVTITNACAGIESDTAQLIINIAPEITEVCYNKESYRGASDASISISAVGGTEPLQYSVDGGLSWFSNEGLFTALDSGGYHISVRDANLCEHAYVNNPVLIPGVHFDRVWSGNPLNPMYFSITHAMAEEMNLGWMDEIAIYDGNYCVGAVVLTQSIDSLNNATYATINCSQDDSGTPQKEGYDSGNTIHYRLWDESAGEEYIYVHAEYPYAPNYAQTEFASGETDIAQLYAQEAVLQGINLTPGWNLVSFNVVPLVLSMDSIVFPLIDSSQLIKIIDQNGDILQQMPWGWVNNIGNMSNEEGYQVKVTEQCSLLTTGIPASLPFAINFETGWNLMGWPAASPNDAEMVFTDLISNGILIKVIDESGNILQQMPWGWVNNIGDLESGEGYQVKVNDNTILTINEPPGDYKSSEPARLKTQYLISKIQGNPYNPMTFAIHNNGSLPQNAEIGVYKNEQCYGAAVLTGDYIYISAGTDEADTDEKEGFTPGDAFTFKYITEGMQEPLELEVTWLQGDKTYTERGTFVGEIKSITAAEVLQATASWIGDARPNPARDEVFVDYYLNSQANLSWKMVDAQGRVLLQDQKETPHGRQQQRFDLGNLPSGIYYLHLKAEGEGMFAEKVLRIVRL